MAKDGPIVIVEDDKDDQDLMKEILGMLNVDNKVLIFDRCRGALHYLRTTKDRPFVIISDVNLPEQNGIEFKREIDSDALLRKKSIPFIFLSTSINQSAVNEAYTKMTVQGFFQKAGSLKEMKLLVQRILDYWCDSSHPNAG